ncbi:helix-turn-helix domain-containing protein [Bifidobacterium adolescentis]|uniref:helix-turn-helix domain-containing protein n=1 Tax=Bifidobacterium adolescentis TaxID=1680 RepID=UPI001EDE9426|nr:helix-turn-helix domain-containing protein [Bifidobacterium adolescentis]MCG4793289.1 DNA-binding protein [Bifidobacterium adolescentis]
MSGPEERQRAMDLYSATPMTTAQVVEHLAYPTRQCLERWPAADSRYAGHMAKLIIPLETRTKAIEPVPDGMQQKRAAERLGAGIGTVRNRVRAYREDGMAALRPENRDAG